MFMSYHQFFIFENMKFSLIKMLNTVCTFKLYSKFNE